MPIAYNAGATMDGNLLISKHWNSTIAEHADTLQLAMDLGECDSSLVSMALT